MSKSFEIVKKGYDPSEVDSYVEALENVIASYKEKDTAIKNAILSAQIAADNIILNAKNEANEIRSTAIRQVSEIAGGIDEMKKMVATFHMEYEAMLNKYLRESPGAEVNNVYDKIGSLQKYLDKLQNNNISTHQPKAQNIGAMPAHENPLAPPKAPAFNAPEPNNGVTAEERSALLN